jgi:hypothetical protein
MWWVATALKFGRVGMPQVRALPVPQVRALPVPQECALPVPQVCVQTGNYNHRKP